MRLLWTHWPRLWKICRRQLNWFRKTVTCYFFWLLSVTFHGSTNVLASNSITGTCTFTLAKWNKKRLTVFECISWVTLACAIENCWALQAELKFLFGNHLKVQHCCVCHNIMDMPRIIQNLSTLPCQLHLLCSLC